MGRPITSKDPWGKRVLKQIPTEVITAYTGILGVFAGMESVHIGIRLLMFIVCLGAVPLYLYLGQNVRKWWQLLAGVIAFVFWDMTIPGGLFSQWDAWNPGYGSAFLGLYTFLIAPLVAGGSEKQRDA